MTEALSRRAALGHAAAVAGLGLLTATSRAHAQRSIKEDLPVVRALLAAERDAVATHDALAGVLAAAPATDALFAFRGLLEALLSRFRQQHAEHAERLVDALVQQRGTDDVGAGTARLPEDFAPCLQNALDLLTNLEKACALTCTQAQTALRLDANGGLAASLGAVASQRFVVLNLLARGLATPPAATANQPADALASLVAAWVPRSLAISLDDGAGLDDETGLPFYDVTR
nr:ferritin-like domain-containing protein [Myxococcus sp. MH1]